MTEVAQDQEVCHHNPVGSSIAEAYLQDHHRIDVPVALNTGCSLSVSPFLEDFTTELTPTPDVEMTQLTLCQTSKCELNRVELIWSQFSFVLVVSDAIW